MLACTLCGADTNGQVHYRTLEIDLITRNGSVRKGATVRFCSTCVSAHGFVMGKEYNWRKYGDERPNNMRSHIKTRGGCPNCEIDCSVCPYNKED